MIRYALPAIVFLALVAIFFRGLFNDPTKLPSTFIDKPAPPFELAGLSDPSQVISNETFAGQKVLVNFWATWCAPCRAEHDFLMQIASSGVIPIYGINWRDDRGASLNWLQQLGDPYVVSAFDGENRAGIDWGVYAAPETFLVDEAGTVIYKHLGELTPAAWQEHFVPLLDGAGQ